MFRQVSLSPSLLVVMIIPALTTLALGLALGRWYWVSSRSPDTFRPWLLSSKLGTSLVVGLSAICTLGGLGLVLIILPPGILLLTAGGVLLFLFGRSAATPAGRLRRELTKDFEGAQKEYPDLDRQALFIFMVKDRFPEWEADKIRSLVEDCDSIGDLASKIAGMKHAEAREA